MKLFVAFETFDEARHVTFGVNYLEEFVKTLPQEEIEARAQFAYEACVVSRERLVATDVFRHFGWDVEEARKKVLDGFVMSTFRNLLFQRVVPNLKRIGLLTDQRDLVACRFANGESIALEGTGYAHFSGE